MQMFIFGIWLNIFCRHIRQVCVVAVISIATGKRIGFAYRALVMTVYKYQLNVVAAKKAFYFHGLFF
jgi:predicted lysophospholipase L1 biosynthesis ABC-type transport system permease subunit